ncbi:MAG: glycerophosphodiester phosphodiesterase [Oligoflexales bacterium]
MFDQSNSINWISHRGLCSAAAENTSAAFQAAIKNGFKCLETDLRVTKDRHIVLSHDPTFKRFLGPDTPIWQLTRTQISTLALGIKEPIMFFDEFVEKFAAYQWVLDIKPEQGLTTINCLSKWARSKKAHAWISENSRFLFWNREHEQRFLNEFPNAKLYARSSECWSAGLAVLFGLPSLGRINPAKVYAIPPRLGKLQLYKQRLVDAFHKKGAKVIAFLPQTKEDANAAIKAGVDEILTDHNFLNCARNQELN